MKIKINILISFILCYNNLISQDISSWKINKILDIPILLSGTFAEPRSSHLHYGIDIKTNSQEGLNVYSVDSGYIYRIGVSTYGYGKFIEVMHSNGYRTLYAHLSSFRENIDRYVKDYQYRHRSFDVKINFEDSTIFRVNKLGLLGLSGNTGFSSGPHLHFELRKKNKIINPMYLNLDIKDEINPILKNIFVYSFYDSLKQKKVDRMERLEDTLYVCGNIGIGLETFDMLDGADNNNGVYSIKLSLNSNTFYEFKLDSMYIYNSRYLYEHIDYEIKHRHDANVIKCFIKGENNLGISNTFNDGIIKIEKDSTYNLGILIEDFYENKNIFNINIIGGDCDINRKNKYDNKDNLILKNESKKINNDHVNIFFPKNTFNDDIEFEFSKTDSLYNIHKPWVYINRKYKVEFKYNDIDTNLKNKLVLMRLGKDSSLKSPKIVKVNNNNHIQAWLSKLGSYAIVYDTVSPIITPLNLKDTLDSSLKYINFEIKDDISGVASVYASVDGEWVLLEYEHKYNLYKYDLIYSNLSKGTHNLYLKATDLRGNESKFEYVFFYDK